MGDTKDKEVEARQSPLNSSTNRNNSTSNKTFNGNGCSAETVVVQAAQVPVDVHYPQQQARVIAVHEHVAAASNPAVRNNSKVQCCYPVSEMCSSQLYRQLRNASLRTTQLLCTDPYEKNVLQQYICMISWCCARVVQLLTMHPGLRTPPLYGSLSQSGLLVVADALLVVCFGLVSPLRECDIGC